MISFNSKCAWIWRKCVCFSRFTCAVCALFTFLMQILGICCVDRHTKCFLKLSTTTICSDLVEVHRFTFVVVHLKLCAIDTWWECVKSLAVNDHFCFLYFAFSFFPFYYFHASFTIVVTVVPPLCNVIRIDYLTQTKPGFQWFVYELWYRQCLFGFWFQSDSIELLLDILSHGIQCTPQ